MVTQDREQLLRESRELREELRKEVTRLNAIVGELSDELELTREELRAERAKREQLDREIDNLRNFVMTTVERHPCDHGCGILSALRGVIHHEPEATDGGD